MPEVGELLAAYDAQLRGHVHDRLPDSVRVERDGQLVRTGASAIADSSSTATSPASKARSSTG
jgi:hypothetical protein